MHPILKSVVGILVLLASAISVSHARDYEVEVIVFERYKPEDLAGVSWELTPIQLADHLARLNDLSSKTSPMAYQPELNHLSQVARNLEDSGFSLLQTAQWIQPPSYFQNAPIVALGDEYSMLPYAYIRIYRTSLIFADLYLQFSPNDPEPEQMPHGPEPTVSLPQATEQLAETDPLPETETASASALPADLYYILSEKRRLKFGEIHYFDHPRFGVMLGVWPNPE